MRFLFIVTDFDIGGITSSLCNLTATLCDRGHEVEILNLPKAKCLPHEFDKRIKLVPLDKRAELWNLSAEDIKKAGFLGKIKYSVLGIFKKLMNRSESWLNYVFKNTRFEGYDAVIGFRQSPVCFYLASRKSIGGKKCGFWHIDVNYAGDISSWDYFLTELDKIACVSNATRNGMMEKYSLVGDSLCTVYNVFDAKKICNESVATNSPYDKGKLNIVTVSRIEFEQKQLQFVPQISACLKKAGIEHDWHIVGDGPHREELKRLIVQNGVEDCVILHGAKSNPYPYLKNAELFVLTSIWETYGMVVVESLICGTPVVAGYYPALPEILSDGENGIIAENSAEGIAKAIVRVVSDRELYEKIKSGAENYSYTPDIAYNQFVEMVNKNA